MKRFHLLSILIILFFVVDVSAKKYTRQSDSLELVKLYQQTNGSNWINNSGWRDGSLPVWKWFGISTDFIENNNDTIVVVSEIDLDENNLTGILPVLNLPNMYGMFVKGNNLHGKVPLIKNDEFIWFDVSHNKYLFDDFLDNFTLLSELDSFIYDPQDTTFNLNVTFRNDTIFLEHPYIYKSSKYNWYENDKIVSNEFDNKFNSTGLFNKYSCEATHPKIPNLKFRTKDYRILIEAISPVDNAKDIENPVLKWTEVSIADKYVIVSTMISNTLVTKRYDTTSSTTFTYPENLELYNLKIEWYVYCMKGNKNGTSTKTRTFFTKVLNEYTEPKDSLELVRFYNENGGKDWKQSNKWLTVTPVWQWYGITTVRQKVGNEFIHRVTKVTLYNNNINLNNFYLDLPFLESLDLRGNKSIITMNSEKLNLPNLTYLILSDNEFQSDASVLNKLEKLNHLELNNNKLKSINGLNLNQLIFLYINGNEFTDGNFNFTADKLSFLYVNQSKIKGKVSNLKLPGLLSLYMNNNEITEFTNFEIPSIIEMDFSKNMFTDFEKINVFSSMDSLKTLNMSNNKLSGSISAIKLNMLNNLNLSYNQFSGLIDLKNMPNLLTLNLENNNYSDVLDVANISNLENLLLSNNKITEVKSNLNMPKLKQLTLSNNLINKFFKINLPVITIFSLDNNKLSGVVPDLTKDYPNLITGRMNISGNLFTFEDFKPNFTNNKKIFKFNYSDQKIKYKYTVQKIWDEYRLELIYDGIADRFEWLDPQNKVVSEDKVFQIEKPFSNYRCRISYVEIPGVVYYSEVFNPMPTKLYPSKDSTGIEPEPVFRWTKLEYAYKYRVYVSETPDMTTSYYIETTDTIAKLQQVLLPKKTYYWTLQTLIENNATAFNVEPWAFTTSNYNINFNQKDSLALVDFYNKTNGKNWNNQYNWLTDTSITAWTGVKFKLTNEGNSYNGHVTQITLIDNNLEGEIDKIELDSLYSIDLRYNKLSGKVPEFTSKNLYFAYLSNNQFTDGLDNLMNSNAHYIDLSKNNFSGEIEEIKGDNLEIILLSSNNFTGKIPELNAPALSKAALDSNKFNSMNDKISHSNLQELKLNDNRIYGLIPDFDTPLLESLILSNNNFYGEIPSFDFPQINRIELANNKLTGKIPQLLTPNVKYLDFSKNKLSGDMPSKPSIMIYSYNISNNKFTFENISPTFNEYFSNGYLYYPQDTVFNLLPIEEGGSKYLEIETQDHIQKYYTWFRNDVQVSNKEKRIQIDDPDAVYHCIVGSKTLDKLFISTIKSSYNGLTSVEDFVPSDINISPNPATDFITINPGNKGLKPLAETDEQVEIYNSFGELVIQDVQSLGDVGHLLRIDVSYLPVGLYFVKIGSRIEKFVKI